MRREISRYLLFCCPAALACSAILASASADEPPEPAASSDRPGFVVPAGSDQRQGNIETALGERLGKAISRIGRDRKRASADLEALLADAPLLEDVILYYLGIADRKDNPARARSRFERALAYPDSVVAPKAAAALAELLLEARENERLDRLATQHAANTTRQSLDAARVALAAAKAASKRNPRRAAELYLAARQEAPGTSVGNEAAGLLVELRKTHPELAPTSGDAIYEEAVLVGREGDLGGRVAGLDRFLARFPKDPRRTQAILMRGTAVARVEGRSVAAKWLAEQAAHATTARSRARFLHASAINDWNAHNSTRAADKFERMLAMNSGVAEEQRASYALGRIHERGRRYNAAAKAYRKAADGHDPELRRESQWRAGWASYLAGNFEGAAMVFAAMVKSSRREHDKGKSSEEALYWQARSLERAGKDEEATRVYRTLLDEVPDGYYAYLVETRRRMMAEAPTIEALDAATINLSGATRTALKRSQALHAAGLRQLSMAEVARAARTARPDQRRAILPYLLELGAYTQALRTSLALYHDGLLAENQLYPYLYPHAFADVVAREAPARGIDPFLVYSLIRQESLFNHQAVSPAAAYGLMQLLLPTARRVAASAGIESVELEDLFRPEINVRLGVAYLAQLAERFDHNTVLMLASYNAGERAADRWQAQLTGLELDELVEQISYSETRNYVKKILRNYRNYRRLYGGTGLSTAAQGGE